MSINILFECLFILPGSLFHYLFIWNTSKEYRSDRRDAAYVWLNHNTWFTFTPFTVSHLDVQPDLTQYASRDGLVHHKHLTTSSGGRAVGSVTSGISITNKMGHQVCVCVILQNCWERERQISNKPLHFTNTILCWYMHFWKLLPTGLCVHIICVSS